MFYKALQPEPQSASVGDSDGDDDDEDDGDNDDDDDDGDDDGDDGTRQIAGRMAAPAYHRPHVSQTR